MPNPIYLRKMPFNTHVSEIGYGLTWEYIYGHVMTSMQASGFALFGRMKPEIK